MTSYYKIVLIAVIVVAYTTAFVYVPQATRAGTRQITITKGLGSRKIAEVLKKEGFIRSKWAFIAYVTLTNKANRLQPGSYLLGPETTIPNIVSALTSKGTHEIIITIPEGWNTRELSKYLDSRGIVSEEDFLAIVEGRTHPVSLDQFSFLRERPQEATLEGYLFPDTYRVFSDATTEDIIIKMLENFDHKVTPEMRSVLTARKISVFDAVTMASLVEKEVARKEDRFLVAGILWKRINIGMPLQVDATVNYITGNHSTQVTTKETKVDSLYNTYKYAGLPKGPIANPGIDAIEATIYPKESKNLYYLSASDGKIIYSQTLDEHNIAKAKYLR